jgi:hypothetical protein
MYWEWPSANTSALAVAFNTHTKKPFQLTTITNIHQAIDLINSSISASESPVMQMSLTYARTINLPLRT